MFSGTLFSEKPQVLARLGSATVYIRALRAFFQEIKEILDFIIYIVSQYRIIEFLEDDFVSRMSQLFYSFFLKDLLVVKGNLECILYTCQNQFISNPKKMRIDDRQYKNM